MTSNQRQKGFTCIYCEKNLASQQSLKKHQRRHTGENPYSCISCSKWFASKPDLACHIKIHTDKKPHRCSFCSKRFEGLEKLESHVRVHTGEKPHTCPEPGCKLSFARRTHALAHQRRVHLRITPHVCPTCGKTFVTKYELVLHSRVHTGENPYTCGTCEMRFSRPASLRRHLLVHLGEKPFECLSCGKWFSRESSLHSHVNAQHKPGGSARRACEICQKLVLAKNFKEHLKTHDTSRERLFDCQLCSKSFYAKTQYKTHLSLHGPKQHSCGLCGVSLRWKSNMAQHVRTHTRE